MMFSVADGRDLVQHALDARRPRPALFWATQLLTLSESPQDVMLMAQAYQLGRSFAAAIDCLRGHNLLGISLAARMLACECYLEQKLYEDALAALGEEREKALELLAQRDPIQPRYPHSVKPQAQLEYLRGVCYYRLDNMEKSSSHLRLSLLCDPYCYESWQMLLEFNLLKASDEVKFAELLNFDKSGLRGSSTRRTAARTTAATTTTSPLFNYGVEMDAQILKSVYTLKTNKFVGYQHLEKDFHLLESIPRFDTNLDVMTAQVEVMYYEFDFQRALELSSEVMAQNKHHQECLPLHIAILYELGLKNKLFLLAHELIEQIPEEAVAWHAVGVYYLSIGKSDEAHRHFTKATLIGPTFGPAWVGFGHSFAYYNEHDPALSAYNTASKLLKECHLPKLFIGMEHLRTNNLSLAEQYLEVSLGICDQDPLLWNEFGVFHFKMANWTRAISCFEQALGLLKKKRYPKPTLKFSCLSNLGHAYRKVGRLENAQKSFEDAMSVEPRNSFVHAALGFVAHLQFRLDDAIGYYHKALSLRPDDAFSAEMLRTALIDSSLVPLQLPVEPVKPVQTPRRASANLSLQADRDKPLRVSITSTPNLNTSAMMDVSMEQDDDDDL